MAALARVAADSRRDHGKLVDPAQLAERLSTFDPRPLDPRHLVVDTSVLQPDEAAARIEAALG